LHPSAMAVRRVQESNRFIVGAAIDQRLRGFKSARLLLFRCLLLGAPASSVGGGSVPHCSIPHGFLVSLCLEKNIKTETLQHLHLLVILFLLLCVQNATKPSTIFSTRTASLCCLPPKYKKNHLLSKHPFLSDNKIQKIQIISHYRFYKHIKEEQLLF
jgi:hypothetical protein